MKVKIRKLNKNAVIPEYAHSLDAGMDLTATSVEYDEKNDVVIYGTGVAIDIPKGYVGLIYPRSSIYKTDLTLANSTGVIDAGYNGELKLIFNIVNPYHEACIDQLYINQGVLQVYTDVLFKDSNISSDCIIYPNLSRIGQLIIVPIPKIKFKEVEDLGESERGVNGFGSTGN